MSGHIYLITNKMNGKMYIGQTTLSDKIKIALQHLEGNHYSGLRKSNGCGSREVATPQ
jgi:predicted GIY-YIG superfamily endonuclease